MSKLSGRESGERDAIEALIEACVKNSEDKLPCGRCNYCTARKHIAHFRELDKLKAEGD